MEFAGFVAADGHAPGASSFTVSGMTELPETVLRFVQQRIPTFQLQHSRTAGYSYLANTCPHCGAMTGDYYLYSEPEAPFFPITKAQASSLLLEEIPLDGPLELDANPGFGIADLILQHGQRASDC